MARRYFPQTCANPLQRILGEIEVDPAGVTREASVIAAKKTKKRHLGTARLQAPPAMSSGNSASTGGRRVLNGLDAHARIKARDRIKIVVD
jgi:hypothetical protein